MTPHDDDAPEGKEGFPSRPGTPEPKFSLKNTLTKWFVDCISAGAIMNTVAFLLIMGIFKGQSGSQIWSNIMTVSPRPRCHLRILNQLTVSRKLSLLSWLDTKSGRLPPSSASPLYPYIDGLCF
ncbi:hypothetical protein AUP68_01074 [Ilyonectria robusta]